MGSPKASLAFAAGETFLEHLLAAYGAIGCDAIVVIGADARFALRASTGETSLPPTAQPRATARLAVNTDVGADRLSSIRCGLALVPHGSAVFVQDVDRPFVTASTLRSLVSAARAGGYSAPDLGGRGGHPLLLSPAVVEALRVAGRPSIPPIDGRPSTLREALLPFERTLVAVDDVRCDLNINTPADYRRHLSDEAHDVA